MKKGTVGKMLAVAIPMAAIGTAGMIYYKKHKQNPVEKIKEKLDN